MIFLQNGHRKFLLQNFWLCSQIFWQSKPLKKSWYEN